MALLAALRGGRRALAAIALVALCAAAAAQPAPKLAPVQINEQPATIDADALGEFLIDRTGSATIEQVAQGHTVRFEPMRADAIHELGPTAALWLHYRLLRNRAERHDWLIDFPMPVLDAATVYQQEGNGPWHAQSAGDTIAVADWPEPGRYPSFRLDLPPGQVRDVYVRIRHITPASIPVRLTSEMAYDQRIQVEYLGLGMAFGSLLLLIIACVAQSWVYRDRAYAWYAVYAGITTLAVAAYTGVAGHLLWNGSGYWADAAQGCLTLLAAGAAMLFARHLTGMPGRFPWIGRFVQLTGLAGIAVAAAYPFVFKPAAVIAIGLYVGVAVATIVAIAFMAWRRGDAVGAWVLAAYMPLALSVLLAILRVFGWLPVSFGTQYAVVVAMALQVPLLMVALSLRSRERHGAQIRELALSSQDALTGLLAAHLFHDRLRQVISHYRRDRRNAAVVFIDLVNHARIKEFYGAAVAEQSLLRSVIKLRRLLRDVDTVSRIGEARFGLIMEGISSRHVVTDRAARLIAAGLMPLKGLKPDVTLQFHIGAVLLGERTMEARELADALGELLGGMSPRTRRPIRFLDPEATRPAPLEMDSLQEEGDEDSVPPRPAPASMA